MIISIDKSEGDFLKLIMLMAKSRPSNFQAKILNSSRDGNGG